MERDREFLSPSEAARRLGVSAKALRVYEERGLIKPARTDAGWRAYGPEAREWAAQIVALRKLGLSLAQTGLALEGDTSVLADVLCQHRKRLEREAETLSGRLQRVAELQAQIASGAAPDVAAVAGLAQDHTGARLRFELPWPWGGERFAFNPSPAITFITGPLGSGKTQLAMALAENMEGGRFLGLERSLDAVEGPCIEAALDWLAGEGAEPSEALRALLATLEDDRASVLVVDLVEYGLDEESQTALMAYLRRKAPRERPLFLMTRSAAILDLDALGPDEAIIYCPANHSPPMIVAPYAGSPGYEAVATCLAPPEVRARTEGVIAMRPPTAAQG